MFDFAGSEIALVAVVALILIGPKDLPVAVKAVTGVIKKARRMASEFQVHVDDMMKDADMGDLRSGIQEIRRMDIKGRILGAIDDDGSLRRTVTEVGTSGATSSWTPPAAPVPAATEVAATEVAAVPEHTIANPFLADASISGADLTQVPGHEGVAAFTPALPQVAGLPGEAAPAFIPPRAARNAPAFIPPGMAQA